MRATTPDPYAICRYIAHYHAKNGYALRVGCLGCVMEYEEKMVANGIIERLPLYEGGPPVAVVLTDKGLRMASAQRRKQSR
jgi:hypothetical protein